MRDDLNLAPFYHYHRLANGVQLLGYAMPSLRSVTFGCQFDAAVIHEPEGKQGLAHLFEYLLFQGTKKRDARMLSSAFETLGARRGIDTGFETACVWTQVVHTELETALRLVSELLLEPAFPVDKLAHIQKIVLQEIHRCNDEARRRVIDLTCAKFYRGTSLSRSLLGTAESIASLKQEDFLDFWQSRYQPNNMLFAIAGKFQWEKVLEQMEALFGGWQGEAMSLPMQQLKFASTLSIEHREGQQEHFCLMFPFPNYADPDYYAALLINDILGGSMHSRLFVEVREKRSLVYSISSTMVSNRSTGAVRIYAATTPEQGRKCLAVILDELYRLRQNGITHYELNQAKIHLKSQHILRGESSRVCMSTMAYAWWFNRTLPGWQAMKAAIDAVTEEQILRVLQRFSPVNPLTITAITPLEPDVWLKEAARHSTISSFLTDSLDPIA
ncbi:MAG TPA: pitrilysin family protein [Ktedonobacteraceae bacterium]|nr:pitrilysin family protein [Ktedonobacteraceae bacterium]